MNAATLPAKEEDSVSTAAEKYLSTHVIPSLHLMLFILGMGLVFVCFFFNVSIFLVGVLIYATCYFHSRVPVESRSVAVFYSCLLLLSLSAHMIIRSGVGSHLCDAIPPVLQYSNTPPSSLKPVIDVIDVVCRLNRSPSFSDADCRNCYPLCNCTNSAFTNTTRGKVVETLALQTLRKRLIRMGADEWIIETVEECITLLNVSEKFQEKMVWEFMLDKQGRTREGDLGMLEEDAGKRVLVIDKKEESLKGGPPEEKKTARETGEACLDPN